MSGIFGSPPEPLFNDKRSLPCDLLEDLYHLQAKQNEEDMHTGSSDDGNFKHGTWSETIFLICKKFQQPAETRYLAVEIFDRFMVKSLKNLHKLDGTLVASRWCIPVSVWNKSSRKCKKRILLYLITCIQVASKMCSHYRDVRHDLKLVSVMMPSFTGDSVVSSLLSDEESKLCIINHILSCRRCCDFLRDAGVFCSKQLVLDSELCVLKTLDYRIQVSTPIVYVETMLEIMGRNFRKEMVHLHPLNTLYGTSLRVLDLVYLNRTVVYSKLYEVVTGDVLGSKYDRDTFMCVEKDGMLLAACVIAAASFILERTTIQQVIAQLSSITNIPKEDIIDFTTVLVVHSLS